MRILMIEDEEYIAEAVATVLRKNKYSVDLAFNGEYGLDCALSSIYDIIILDIMLPIIDGLEVLKEIRRNKIKSKVILLTAKGQIEDKIKGLDLGADDYMPKPFHTEELLARIRALSRRNIEVNEGGTISFNEVFLNPQSLVVKFKDREAELTLKESQILEILMRRRNIIISKESIIEKVWGYDSKADHNNVEIHISLLRKKLKKLKASITIKTIRGAGYTLKSGEGQI